MGDALEALPTVTQLYLSCDAPDQAALEEVGRPLFKDFWERYMRSLDILRTRKERTVCRLTLLRGKNMHDPAAWARLLLRGPPDFVELKGATLAPIFDASGLNTGHMPTHLEAKMFAEELVRLMPGYGIACEHEHSIGVLLASD